MLEQRPGSLAASGLDMHPGIPKIPAGRDKSSFMEY
jgi:hypothetical protein